MAQKVQVILVDDVDGGDASETVTFGLDGVTYEIDLNEKNASKLRDSLATWVGHGRKVGGRSASGTRRRSPVAAATTPRRSGSGPATTGTTSASAAGSRPR